jgi:tetratricopeptide (TPR) repeat protein
MLNKLFPLLAILVMAVSLIGACQTVPKKAEAISPETNPKDAEDYNNQGDAYLRKGQLDLAIADFDKALEINPKYVFAYSCRGSAYRGKGEFDLAIADFNKALEINPKLAFVYIERGDIYRSKGQFELAIADFNEAL